MKRLIIILFLISFLLIQWSDDPNRSSPVFTNPNVFFYLMNAGYYENNLIVLSVAKAGLVRIQALDCNGNRLWGEIGKIVPIFSNGYTMSADFLSDGFDGLIFYTFNITNRFKKLASYVQRMDKDGNYLWGSEGLRAIEHNDFWVYSAGADGTGGVYLGIMCRHSTGNTYHLQRIGPDGNRLWGNTGIKISLSDLSKKLYVRLVYVNNGEAVIAVWSEYLNGKLEIYAQKYDRNGNSQWSSPGILVYSGQHAEPHRFYALSDLADGAIISWSDKRDLGYATHHIFVQHIDGDGNILWNENGEYVGSATEYERNIRGRLYYTWMRDGDGGYIFAWQDERGLVIQRLGTDGKRTWNMDGIIVDPTLKSRYYSSPALIKMSEGKFLLVWNVGFNGNKIFANLYDLSGNSLWNDKLTLQDTSFPYFLYWILPVYDGANGATLIFEYAIKVGIGWHQNNISAFHIKEDGTVGFPFLNSDEVLKANKSAFKNKNFNTEN